MAAATSMGKTQVGSSKFHDFISELETPPPIAKTVHAVHANSGPRTEETSPGQGGVSVDNGTKKASFAGLFSTNRRVTTETKLAKFAVENGTLTLEPTDLVNVRAKMGHCLVGYVAGKFPGLRAIRALAQSWGPSFHQHDSGWLIFRFARDEDRQRVMAGESYFVYGRSILLKIMPDCFEFKEDDISSTPVWAILPSLPLECWHPNALGKIGLRLGTPIVMDSLTMTMERVSYARILVEVNTSKKLVDEVEFILPNGVTRKQRVVYEFTPKFCSECHRFGHLNDSCQGTQTPTVVACPATTATVKTDAPKKIETSDWTLVQRRNRNQPRQQQQNQQQTSPTAVSDEQGQSQQQLDTAAAGNVEKDRPGPSRQEQTLMGQGLILQARGAETEGHSPAGSSGSSNDSGSHP
ncbi:UNVERIFIED_CONTAM: hypothetical protein Slati_3415000 [Sesamum latifolium]|uniref:DUF4283 domain-containing protein n=1 Tax=Sesamum latifolium TaxID=2727402 RepID=A0AAW2UIN9_9LAMI